MATISEEEFPNAAKELQEQAFVDDICGSKSTVEDDVQITNGIDRVLERDNSKIKYGTRRRMKWTNMTPNRLPIFSDIGGTKRKTNFLSRKTLCPVFHKNLQR